MRAEFNIDIAQYRNSLVEYKNASGRLSPNLMHPCTGFHKQTIIFKSWANFVVQATFDGGKSGAIMFFSADKRYIVKQMSRAECKLLCKLVVDYYNHICEVNFIITEAPRTTSSLPLYGALCLIPISSPSTTTRAGWWACFGCAVVGGVPLCWWAEGRADNVAPDSASLPDEDVWNQALLHGCRELFGWWAGGQSP